tara:strand:+ start:646 stop:1023 length:378 start_codon:yes stop_codon:yes gene_type:complete
MLKREGENREDKDKSSLWDMSKKKFESPFSKSNKSIAASNNSNKRFLLLEFFNKKIIEDMNKEWESQLSDSIQECSRIISKRGGEGIGGVANYVIFSSQDMDIYQEAINAEIIEQDNENDENNQL